ncbi:hypothetical protein D3C79_920940 [compost metagenome]
MAVKAIRAQSPTISSRVAGPPSDEEASGRASMPAPMVVPAISRVQPRVLVFMVSIQIEKLRIQKSVSVALLAGCLRGRDRRLAISEWTHRYENPVGCKIWFPR